MNPEENDALWKLLGDAERKPDISPTFAQNVTREARQLGKPKGGFWQNLFASNRGDGWGWARPALAAGGLAAVVIAAIVLLDGDKTAPQSDPGVVENISPNVPESGTSEDPVLNSFESEIERLEQFDALLTVTDVDDLADAEIAMLLF